MPKILLLLTLEEWFLKWTVIMLPQIAPEFISELAVSPGWACTQTTLARAVHRSPPTQKHLPTPMWNHSSRMSESNLWWSWYMTAWCTWSLVFSWVANWLQKYRAVLWCFSSQLLILRNNISSCYLDMWTSLITCATLYLRSMQRLHAKRQWVSAYMSTGKDSPETMHILWLITTSNTDCMQILTGRDLVTNVNLPRCGIILDQHIKPKGVAHPSPTVLRIRISTMPRDSLARMLYRTLIKVPSKCHK